VFYLCPENNFYLPTPIASAVIRIILSYMACSREAEANKFTEDFRNIFFAFDLTSGLVSGGTFLKYLSKLAQLPLL
jgi:hypothetical protein